MEGQTFSHYKVLERLGGGGMGVVYKAEDTRLKRPVALKFLPPELTRDDEARQRFVQEAQAASALDHPNICTIYEIDTAPDGQMFIAMAFYEGETLKKRVERGPLPIEEALDIGTQVARGLAKAHQAGIVHRDIKPANLMITADGLVKIVDFGIAKLLGVTGPTRTGTTLGTVAYMSPEQINGEEADKQTDLWSLGAVLYEMLTGEIPFRGEHQLVLMNAIVNQTPTSVRSARPEIPAALDRMVTRALEKKRGARYGSAGDFLREATECHTSLTKQIPSASEYASVWQALRQPRIAVTGLLITLMIGVGAIWSWNRSADARWARQEAIPEIMRLIQQDEYAAAYALAERAEEYVPDDQSLAGMWPTLSATGFIRTDPAGADVYIKPYGASDEEWDHIGMTPIDDVRVPRGASQFRLDREGYETVYLAGMNRATTLAGFQGGVSLILDEVGSLPPGMIAVAGGEFAVGLTGFATGNNSATVERFFVDKHEVTNREFKDFVDEGGYEEPRFWEGLEFVKDGRALSWQEAMAEFRDATGRPGPSTWELGDYPQGEDEYPVTGVSWYEAMAYANFRGSQLPTVFHWVRAALPPREIVMSLGPSIVPVSNFGTTGPAPVGSHDGMGPFGTYDTAGNVREWCLNAFEDRRWILGGGWSDPEYMFTIPNYLPPFDRSPLNGFRTVKYDGHALAQELTAPVDTASRDYRSAVPVSDEVFEVFRREFSHEKTPLDAAVESRDETAEDWITELVTLDSGYGDERTPVFLFLPKGTEPPYQPVVFFPGIGPFVNARSSADLQPGGADFLIRSGRALVWPIWKGSYERWDEFLRLSGERYERTFRERMLQWHQELARTIDYLETRSEFEAAKLAYAGVSFGSSTAFPLLALEPRLKVAALTNVGLPYRTMPPIADAINYVPRVTMPVLMVSGEYDYVFPVETTQTPMYRLLGTPEQDKRHVLVDAGHAPLPRNRVIREVLAWLDKYLGPVN